MTCLPNLGEKAPNFKANTTFGSIELSDYAGKWVVLFSHPGDFTPVCTTEFIAFTNLAPEFDKRNTTSTVRTVFIIDDKQVLRTILYYPLTTGRNIPEILRIVDALQTADKCKVVTPAN